MVFAHSSVTGTFSQSQSVYLTVLSGHAHQLDAPAPSATVSQPFTVSGWAVDASAAFGTGVDTLHIWAYPAGGGPAVFVGVASYGVSRPDVGAWLQASRFTPSGFVYAASGLAPGVYQLAVFLDLAPLRGMIGPLTLEGARFQPETPEGRGHWVVTTALPSGETVQLGFEAEGGRLVRFARLGGAR